ncbi:hypothetical protein BKA62DRAFT_781662 [Auriculariales sp. MPI-PUGE-AT-0066]|nr:hypothetical protein BKA62DRAFT_781662 [Auriculariales sp. MPI-PUGE-AT-0066]
MPAHVVAFYRIPAELWDKVLEPVRIYALTRTQSYACIVSQLDKSDLNTASRISRAIHDIAIIRLYRVMELSLGKCSDRYIGNLSRTITSRSNLAALVKEVVLDGTLTCDVWLDPTRTDASHAISSRPTVQKWISDRIQDGVSENILPLLVNLETFKFIRGVGAAPGTVPPMFTMLGALYGRQLKYLCLHDASLSTNKTVFAFFTALHTLDLGYSDISHKEFAMLLDQNAKTLTILKVLWVSAMPSNTLFKVAPTATFPQLRELHLTGKVKMGVEETFIFLANAPALRRLVVDELENNGANLWADILDRAMEAKLLTKLEHLFVGGPSTTQSKWWLAVAKLIDRIEEGCLKSLWIHARQINTTVGQVAEMPDELKAVMLHHEGRHRALRDLVVIWRAIRGFSFETIRLLSLEFPDLERLHLYVVHPSGGGDLDHLISAIAGFTSLRRLHLICPKSARNATYPVPDALHPALKDISLAGPDYPFVPYFVAGLLDKCPHISTVSWIRHEPWSEEHENCLFLRIDREGGEIVRCESLTKQHFCIPNSASRRLHSYDVNPTSRILLDQRPNWAHLMGNPFVPGNVCQRAIIGQPVAAAQ